MAPPNPLPRLVNAIQTNAPWQRMVKCCLATTIALIIALLPAFRASSNFLTPMVTVFANPGQRTGLLIQSLLMVLAGSLVGLSWSLLGLFLASLVQASNPSAAYAIRGLFLLVSVLVHGYVRSSSPRLLSGVLLLLMVSLLTIQLPSVASVTLFSTIYIPVLLGAGVLLLVNVAVFPELSSSYLGSSTIDTLSETMDTLTHATHWFITPGGDPLGAQPSTEGASAGTHVDHGVSKLSKGATPGFMDKICSQFLNPFKAIKNRSIFSSMSVQTTRLSHLTGQKAKLRSQLSRCKAVQDEINFEICLSPLPPTAMKPISSQYMTGMVQNVLTLIGACENKFVVVGKDDDASIIPTDNEEQDSPTTSHHPHGTQNDMSTATLDDGEKPKESAYLDRVDRVKPVKELEASSAELLESILARVRGPVQGLQVSLTEAAELVMSCVAYCFDVPKLPSGAPAPKGIPLEELDLRIDHFSDALALFDFQSAEELKRAMMDQPDRSIDFLPGMETFLASSFLLAFRDSAAQLLKMLRHLRRLVEKRQVGQDRSRFWMPQITSFRQWLATGGNEDAPPPKTRKTQRRTTKSTSSQSQEHESQECRETKSRHAASEEPCANPYRKWDNPNDEASAAKEIPARASSRPRLSRAMRARAKAADVMEWAQKSDDVSFALKLAIALFLVSWPALVTSLGPWYAEVRGVWAPMQLILVFEVSIGTSVFTFIIRLFGVLFGCIIGFLAHQIGGGNRVVLVVVMLFGLVPSVYTQLATKYVKAGMVSIVSMSVVALASVNGTTPAYEVFYKRLVAFLVGGLVAMLVEVVVTPVRARDRLVESLSASVRQVQKMQAVLAIGIDGPERPSLQSPALVSRFSHSRDKAQGALAAAEMFLPFCLNEPRLKGSFKPLAPIYEETIYVLHQIIDRMDTVMQLRRVYGSSLLEDLNPKVYAYRRNVAASSSLILFSINEALTTWLPLPQFIPSARLAQLRLINRVRQILTPENADRSMADTPKSPRDRFETDEETASLITKHKFLSWNASAAGQMEIIEYLEELVELVKLLVGVNAFRSGMLERPSYRQYIGRLDASQGASAAPLPGRQAKSPPGQLDDGPQDSSKGPLSGFQLTRAATVSQLADRIRGRGAEAQVEGARAADDGGIPRSLQRVGTRLRQDSTVARRRRAFTTGNRGA